MRNRHKTLLRDHSVPEVTLKACPRHYSVSAIPETLTIRDLKDLPTTLCVNGVVSSNNSDNEGVLLALWFDVSVDETSVPMLSPDRDSTALVDCLSKTQCRNKHAGVHRVMFHNLWEWMLNPMTILFDVAHPGTSNVAKSMGRNMVLRCL